MSAALAPGPPGQSPFTTLGARKSGAPGEESVGITWLRQRWLLAYQQRRLLDLSAEGHGQHGAGSILVLGSCLHWLQLSASV